MSSNAVEVISQEQEEEIQDQELSLQAKLGSILFVSTKPITSEVLAKACSSTIEEVEQCLETLSEHLTDELNGFSLHLVGGSWQLRTALSAKKTINRLIPAKSRKLSRAAAETLAVVAYRQPVQRGEIEAIRGVDALQTLKTLLDAKLIRIVGREQSPGHPALYGTTEFFLEKFGLSDLSQLPTVKELEELDQEPEEYNPQVDSELEEGEQVEELEQS